MIPGMTPPSVAVPGHPRAEDQRRSARKRRAIVHAATSAFLTRGYLGTSMDEIAARAAVSKQTVYKHFADKQRLFSEVVTATVTEVSDPVYAEVGRLPDTGDLAADLRDVARRQLELVLQPRLLQLRRLVIAEAARFPELGRVFFEQGPARTVSALATAFQRLAARGLLRFDDAHLAATQFNWLIMAAPLNQAMLLGQDGPFEAAELDRWAATGVGAFLAAYGTTTRPGGTV